MYSRCSELALRCSELALRCSELALRCSELALVAIALVLLTSCEREERNLDASSGSATSIQQSASKQAQVPGPQDLNPTAHGARFEQRAYDVSEGQRLFEWFNCSGCHSTGGGGSIGPALMDYEWIYGSEPVNIHASIVQGRPNGMPSFGARIPDRQVWQIVAYVRTLSALAPDTVSSARRDTMYVRPRPQSMTESEPKSGNPPPSAQQ